MDVPQHSAGPGLAHGSLIDGSFCAVASISNQGHPAIGLHGLAPGRRRRDPWRLGSAAGPPDAGLGGLTWSLAGGLGTVSLKAIRLSLRLMRRSSRPEGETGRWAGWVIGSLCRPGGRSLKVPGSTTRPAVCVHACICMRVRQRERELVGRVDGREGSSGWTNFESSNFRSLFWGLLTGDLVPLPPIRIRKHKLAPDKPLVRLGTRFCDCE